MNRFFENDRKADERPKITVGVCVKDSALTLDGAIRSIMIQDFPHQLTEVIFVDDGSRDETLSIIQRYMSKMDMYVRVFSTEWRGLGSARNTVVNASNSDFIIWVDGDEVLPRTHVRTQVEFMKNNPDVGIAKARRGLIKGEKAVAFLEHLPFAIGDARNISLDSKLPGTGGSICQVVAIRQIGGFDNGMTGVGEDQDVAYKIKAAGWSLKRSSAIFYEMRKGTWPELWRKYFWYGYGDHDLYLRNRRVFSIHKMTPLAGFVNGFLQIPDAYRLTGCGSVFLLPFHFAFKMTAWCTGFMKRKTS